MEADRPGIWQGWFGGGNEQVPLAGSRSSLVRGASRWEQGLSTVGVASVLLSGDTGHSEAGESLPQKRRGSCGVQRVCTHQVTQPPRGHHVPVPARGALACLARGYFGFAAIPSSRSGGCGVPDIFHPGCKGTMIPFCAENDASSDGLPQEASAWPDGLIPFYAKRTASLPDNIQYSGQLGTTEPLPSIHIFVHLNNHVLSNAQIYS